MNKHLRVAAVLQKIRLAILKDDYSSVNQACYELKRGSRALELATKVKDRFICYPGSMPWDGTISCKPVEDAQVRSLVEGWVTAIRADKRTFEHVGNVIAERDSHPIWRDRAIAILADNEFVAAADDKAFASANLRAALYYVPVADSRFDALATNIVTYFKARYDDPDDTDEAQRNLSQIIKDNENPGSDARIRELFVLPVPTRSAARTPAADRHP